MVKLFGWERKMLSKIQTTRDEELISIWWLKVGASQLSLLICDLIVFNFSSFGHFLGAIKWVQNVEEHDVRP